MKSRRILVLLHPQMQPPADLAGVTPQQANDWRTEHDVIRGLRGAGHSVRDLPLLDRIGDLQQAIEDWRPDIVFNLLEEFDGVAGNDQHVVGLLEMLRQPYTGCNPRGLLLSRDKPLAKRLLASAGVPTPAWTVHPQGRALRLPATLRRPLFVKSAVDDASLGIAHASVVHDLPALRRRIEMLFEMQRCDVLVEDYIPGRECYVGLLGNGQAPRTLPIWEMDFGRLPGQRHLATRQAKWNLAYRARHGIGSAAAADLPEQTARLLQRHARSAWRALSLSGYARIDFRLAPDGQVHVLEANANPCLASHEDYARSAAAGGLAYGALLERILELGLKYPAPWRILHA
ncbi:MAG: hypothetical protein RL026_2404 [Pseudomonadota bacterium]